MGDIAMKHETLALVGWLALALLPHAAKSQSADDAKLQAFARSPFYQSLVNRALAALPETVFKRCPTLVSNGSHVTVLRPAGFAPDGYPTSGVWKQVFPVTGCGNDTILNLYFSARADEKVDVLIGDPGTTHADLTLQRDALPFAMTGASLVVKGCKDFAVTTTRFEAFGVPNPPIHDPGPAQPLRPWWETWTMAGCGRKADVPMDFVPDETGTKIIQPGRGAAR
jgi:hypothetical protein